MTQCWIVEQSSGSYADHSSWPVGVFPTKEAAEEWIAVNQPLFLADLKRQEEEGYEYQRLEEGLLDEFPSKWNETGDCWTPEYEEAWDKLQDLWGDKAKEVPYDEWGYSLSPNPVPYYG